MSSFTTRAALEAMPAKGVAEVDPAAVTILLMEKVPPDFKSNSVSPSHLFSVNSMSLKD